MQGVEKGGVDSGTSVWLLGRVVEIACYRTLKYDVNVESRAKYGAGARERDTEAGGDD